MEKPLIFAAFLLGFSSILTQIILLRESISGFYGNELLLAVVLGNWLFLTAFGSYIGKFLQNIREKLKIFITSEILISLVILPSIFLVKVARSFVAVPGEQVNLIFVFFFSFVVLFIPCLIFGIQFALLCSIFSENKRRGYLEHGANRVYVLESLGSLSGGFLFSYFFIFFLNSFQSAEIVIALNLITALALSKLLNSNERKKFIFLLSIPSLLFLTSLNLDFQTEAIKLQFPSQQLIYHGNSIYGIITITKLQNQLNFYENSFHLFSTNENFSNEERVHYAMLQSSNPKKVLLLSGGISGTLNELLKYSSVEKIDYVELDAKIIEIASKFVPENLGNEKVSIHVNDGRFFVKRCNESYDVIIVDLPTPNSIQVNRFYTLEFFSEVKKILNKDGIFSLRLSSGSGNYLSPEVSALNSAIYKTLKKIFKNVLIIPGETIYFISSDKELDYNYEERLMQKNISTSYMQYYINGKINDERINYFKKALNDSTERTNEDFRPISLYHYLHYWLSLFNMDFKFIIAIFLIILAFSIYITKLKPISLAIMSVGFSGMLIEFILIFGFQILYGYVYEKIGVIITAFMFGLFLASIYITERIKFGKFSYLELIKFQFFIALYSIALPLIFFSISNITDQNFMFFSVEILFPFLTIIIGALVGAVFPLAVSLYEKNKSLKVIERAPLLYSSDLLGACIGAYFGATLLIPILGVLETCIFLFLLNIIIMLYAFFKFK